jgi:hypothetical protein
VPPWHTWDREKAAERRPQSGRVEGSFAVRVGDPGAGAATAATCSSCGISDDEPRTAVAEAPAVLGEVEPAPGPPQVPPSTVADDVTGVGGADGADGALSEDWLTCVPSTAFDSGSVSSAGAGATSRRSPTEPPYASVVPVGPLVVVPVGALIAAPAVLAEVAVAVGTVHPTASVGAVSTVLADPAVAVVAAAEVQVPGVVAAPAPEDLVVVHVERLVPPAIAASIAVVVVTVLDVPVVVDVLVVVVTAVVVAVWPISAAVASAAGPSVAAVDSSVASAVGCGAASGAVDAVVSALSVDAAPGSSVPAGGSSADVVRGDCSGADSTCVVPVSSARATEWVPMAMQA